DGRGIAAIGGKKVFVPGALRGETVRILRRRRHRHFDEAELLDVLEPSPQRVVPRCAVYGVCGGCSLQHLPVADQRALKQDALADTLARIGGVAPRRWLPPVYDEAGEWHYRRRARLAVKDVPGKGRVLVGFRERHTPYVTEMLRCEVLAAPLDALPGPLSELVGRLSIRRRVPQIEAAVADNGTELVFRVLDPPSPADEAELIDFARAHGVRIALQPGGPDSVRPLYPLAAEPLYYELPQWDLRLRFGATDFVQVNGPVNARMVAAALELLDPPSPADEAELIDFARAHGVRIALQPGGPDSVRPLYPLAAEPLYYELPQWDLRLRFGATDFVQVNGPVNARMVAAALELLDPGPGESV